MTSIIVDTSNPQTLRHVASIILDIVVVKYHWEVGGDEDQLDDTIDIESLYVITEDEKSIIRSTLPNSLGDSSSKIRKSIAKVLATIGAKVIDRLKRN